MDRSLPVWVQQDGQIRCFDRVILSDVPSTVTTIEDASDIGIYLRFQAETAAARHQFVIGGVAGLTRFTCCHRYEPFWMEPKAGIRTGDVPVETQYLLCEGADGSATLLVPLIDGDFRCSLEGSEDDRLLLVAETGDDAVVGDSVVGLFVAHGYDVFDLLETAALSVARRLKTRLRREKQLPAFCNPNLFGWCTWDAFYQEVSHDKVREGLESFRSGGIQPKYLILDDGWQSVRQFPTGERRLTDFQANAKFPGDLAPTVAMAKQEYGIELFLVWHAVGGYWGGVDAQCFPGYGVRSVSRQYSEGINHYVPGLRNWFGTACGMVAPEQVYRFYHDYHRHLRNQGVDGVKVDNQASLEGIAHGANGRVAVMRAYREALEGSVHVHFQGNLINCMSCANEMLYMALNSNLTRTSTDFWPNRPESHGLHLYCNAQVSAWFGEFIHPDWDMFQSGHEMGAYHAAGRAVGGCPVYVSDKPGQHNFDVLRKLVLPGGVAPGSDGPGRPTRDCLFHDPTREDVLLKIWNRNEWGEHGGIVGVFHARYGENVGPISGVVRPADVPGLWQERFAVYAHRGRELRAMGAQDEWPITLEPLQYEVFVIVPIVEGIAPIGLTQLFNSAAAIHWQSREEPGVCLVELMGGGEFTAYCEREPERVTVAEEDVAFFFDTETHCLTATLPELEYGSIQVKIYAKQ